MPASLPCPLSSAAMQAAPSVSHTLCWASRPTGLPATPIWLSLYITMQNINTTMDHNNQSTLRCTACPAILCQAGQPRTRFDSLPCYPAVLHLRACGHTAAACSPWVASCSHSPQQAAATQPFFTSCPAVPSAHAAWHCSSAASRPPWSAAGCQPSAGFSQLCSLHLRLQHMLSHGAALRLLQVALRLLHRKYEK